jgi:hypothetical protein
MAISSVLPGPIKQMFGRFIWHYLMIIVADMHCAVHMGPVILPAPLYVVA